MKTLKFIYIGLAAALLSSCIQEVQPEGMHVSGMWAIVNEQSQTNKYIKFEDGYLTEYTASDFQTVAEGQIWHASAADFKGAKSQKYRLNPDGQLFLDGKSAGELVIDGDKMKYGKQDAVAVTGFSKDWYSAIVTGVSNNQINADLLAQEFTYDLSVINPIPNSSVKISVSPAGSASVTTLPDGKYKISLPEINSNSTATVNFTYPGAAPAKVNVTRQASSSISVSKTEWSYEYYAQSVSIPFTLSNPSAGATVAAELTSNSPWIKNVSVGATSLEFFMDENNDSYQTQRMASIKLSAKGCLDVILNITQRYTAPVITYSPTSLSTNYTAKTGQSFRYTVANTRDGGSTTVSCSSSWITNLKDNNGTVTFDVAENNSGSTRSASISTRYNFGGYSITKSFAVSQTYSSTSISFSPTSQTTDYTAKSLSFTYSIDNPRDGVSASASTTDTWITDVKVSGNTVSYKVAENNSGSQRTGKIKLTYGTSYKEFSVTQSFTASVITCNPTSQSTDYTAKSLSFSATVTNLREGCSLAASTTDDWITNVQLSGSTVSYKVTENNSGSSRTGKIKLTYGSVTKEFSVTQNFTASVITCDPSSQSTDYTAKSLSFTATVTNLKEGCQLAVSTTDSWIQGLRLNGSSVSYSVPENNTGSTRYGTIVLTYGNVTKEFSVTQYRTPDITLTPSSLSTDYSAKKNQTFTYSISSPCEGGATSVTCSSDWISNLKDNNGSVTFDITENNSGSSRLASISVKYSYGGKYLSTEFTVSQSYSSIEIILTPASQTTDYTAKSMSFTYSISNPREGVTASVSTYDSWITNVRVSGTTVSYKIAENNSGSQRTGKIKLTYGTAYMEFAVTQIQKYVDLSLNGTANCYIVTSEGSYKIKTVKGNSSTSIGTVASVEVLWESFGNYNTPSVGDLVSNVTYSDDYIYFNTSNKKGNALIAAKNASGIILWSWHIWLTNQPNDQEYNNNAGTMMDRNLGATSVTWAYTSRGLLYQWGRKDPFLSGGDSYDNQAKSTISWPSAVLSDSSSGTIAYATAHPTTFITVKDYNLDWYYTESSSPDNTRWQTSDKTKGLYDPCPAGYRVPDGGINGVWAKAFGTSSKWWLSSWYEFQEFGETGFRQYYVPLRRQNKHWFSFPCRFDGPILVMYTEQQLRRVLLFL